ncbi:MAG TPA: glycosyltransferase family 2 protein [Clostridiales bacterium]|nr:glycosyltransferase family 2 protein [Clostridiales bacterium]
MPIITVVLPVYNAEKYLEECVDSVINQTFKDIEILLINDGSTDSSADLCDRLAAKDSRIKVYHRPNSGPSITRNLGIDVAAGEYICFIDSDDYLDPPALEFMYNSITLHNADMVMCGFYHDVEQNGTVVYSSTVCTENKIIFSHEEILDVLIELKSKHLIDSCCNKLYRLSTIRDSGVRMPEGELFEDTEFNFRLLPFLKKIVISDKCFYHYRQRDFSITKSFQPLKIDYLTARYNTIYQYISSFENIRKELVEFNNFYYIKSVFSCFIDLFFPSSDFPTFNSRREFILKKINSNTFSKAANNCKGNNKKDNLIIFLAKSKNVLLIYCFCRIMFVLKYRMKKLFTKIKEG